MSPFCIEKSANLAISSEIWLFFDQKRQFGVFFSQKSPVWKNVIDSSLTSKPTISFGFVECTMCDLSFYGTNATLDMHMNDVHQNQIQYIEGQNGEEIFQVFINDGIVSVSYTHLTLPTILLV